MTDKGCYEGKMTRERVPVRLGPVVEIAQNKHVTEDYSYCAYECNFFVEGKAVEFCSTYDKCNAGFDIKKNHPNPDICPGPAPPGHHWRLALFAKGEEEVGDEANP